MTVTADQPTWVSGTAATMTILATGLGSSITAADPVILSANISAVRAGLQLSAGTASFVASVATLTLAATVLGAGALGDKHGMKRMYTIGLLGTVVFGVLAAAAPNAAVLIFARAAIGVAFALQLGLSLAIINVVFPPPRRAIAISLHLGASFAVAVPMPAVGSLLVAHIGWRTGFLVAPAVALIALVLLLRYVPETPRGARRLDVPGLLLVAAALLATVYGLAHLQGGLNATAIACIAFGLAAGAGFVAYELRTPSPALDMRIFRSGAFDAAVFAGASFNFLGGGMTILLAFYLVSVRDESSTLLGLLMAPAALLSALGAAVAGRAAARVGGRAVLVAGLLLLLAGLLVLTRLGEHSPLWVLFAAVGLNAVGAAVAETIEATIMLETAPVELSGAVSAVKSGVGQAAYSLGPAVFALIGTTVFLHSGRDKLAGAGITDDQAREALRVAHGGPGAVGGANVLDPQRAREVVAGAQASMVEAIHTLGWILTAVPVVAIVVVLVLVRPRAKDTSTGGIS
ncbi:MULTISPECIES: MFS transporter [unclassified Mycolicibacterium]|uniref:MFS transporter n=1 Tax=unclassified Mycolicibacterium TaxID=2636767 RepID=UPI002EDB6D01